MFARVTVHASDLEASRRFSETLFGDWGTFRNTIEGHAERPAVP